MRLTYICESYLSLIRLVFTDLPSVNDNTVWIEPNLSKIYDENDNGSLRQPVFKGLRDDKVT